MTPAELLLSLAALAHSTSDRLDTIPLALSAAALLHTEGSEAPLDPRTFPAGTLTKLRVVAADFAFAASSGPDTLPGAVLEEIARALFAAADTLEAATATLEEPTP